MNSLAVALSCFAGIRKGLVEADGSEVRDLGPLNSDVPGHAAAPSAASSVAP